MSKLFEEMVQGTAEARAYMEGSRDGYQVTLPESIDVRGIRNRLRFSQDRFAAAFGLSVDAVRHWESGRRTPEAAARALLGHFLPWCIRSFSGSEIVSGLQPFWFIAARAPGLRPGL